MTDPERAQATAATGDSSLAVILWRLGNIEQQLGQLVTAEHARAIERRVQELEDARDADARWRRSLGLGVLVALVAPTLAYLAQIGAVPT